MVRRADLDPEQLLRPSEADALAAWRALMEAADGQAGRLREGPPAADYWGAMADWFAPGAKAYPAPELPVLESLAEPDDEWLEIAAGGGRLAIPLARRVRRMVAFDRSPVMTDRLRAEAEAAGLERFEVLTPRAWPPDDPADPSVPVVDVALAASVIFFIPEVGRFLDAMERHARRRCVVVVMDRRPGTPWAALWSELHDEPAAIAPALHELLAVLGARDRAFELRIVRPPPEDPLSIEDGLALARRRLLLREGSERDRHLRALLHERYADAAGRIVLPKTYRYTGVVSWEPRPA